MQIELSPDDMQMIDCWYQASAGESAHNYDGADWKMIAGLLAKLGIEWHLMDQKQLAAVASPALPASTACN